MDGLVAISNGRTTAGAAGGTQVDFGTLTRTNGGVLWLRAPTGTSNGQIGGAPGALTINYRFSNLSPLSGLGTTSAEILPWAAQVTSSRTGTDPTRPVTYDVNGLRPLADSEFTSVTSAASWGAGLTGQNINLQATVTNAGNLTINSLFNTGTTSPTLNGSGTVTITSGYLSNFLTFTINGPNLAFGSNPAYFHLGFPVNFTGAGGILGSGGVVVSSISNSTSYLVSFGATTVNDFTGGLTINGQARVRFNNDGQLGNLATTGDNAGGIYLNGGILPFVLRELVQKAA